MHSCTPTAAKPRRSRTTLGWIDQETWPEKVWSITALAYCQSQKTCAGTLLTSTKYAERDGKRHYEPNQQESNLSTHLPRPIPGAYFTNGINAAVSGSARTMVGSCGNREAEKNTPDSIHMGSITRFINRTRPPSSWLARHQQPSAEKAREVNTHRSPSSKSEPERAPKDQSSEPRNARPR